MKSYAIISFRLYNTEYQKIMSCKMILEEKDLRDVIEFLDSSDKRILVYDDIKIYSGKELINQMVKKVKNDIDQEMLF